MSNEPPTTADALDAVGPLRARVAADLRTAMKVRDKPAITTLRCLLAVLDNAGAPDPAAYPVQVFGRSAEILRKPLTQGELQTLIKAEATSRRAAVIEYERAGRKQDAARLQAELTLLGRYVAL
jgi:uncharacterized protein YqeY